jgi:hypothetical protein
LVFGATCTLVFCSTIFIWAFLHSSADLPLQSYVGRALQGFRTRCVPSLPISIPNATQKTPFFTLILLKNRDFREKIHFFCIFLKTVQSNWTLFLYLCRKFQRSCMENDALIKKAVKNALLDTLSAKGKELNLSPKQGAEIVADFATEYLLVSCDYTGASHEQIIEEYIKHLRENLVNWLNNKKQAK